MKNIGAAVPLSNCPSHHRVGGWVLVSHGSSSVTHVHSKDWVAGQDGAKVEVNHLQDFIDGGGRAVSLHHEEHPVTLTTENYQEGGNLKHISHILFYSTFGTKSRIVNHFSSSPRSLYFIRNTGRRGQKLCRQNKKETWERTCLWWCLHHKHKLW